MPFHRSLGKSGRAPTTGKGSGGPSMPPPKHTRSSELRQTAHVANTSSNNKGTTASNLLTGALDYRFAAAREVSAEDMMRGLSAINQDNMIQSLMEHDDLHWAELVEYFKKRQDELEEELGIEKKSEEMTKDRLRRMSQRLRRKSSVKKVTLTTKAQSAFDELSSDDSEAEREDLGLLTKAQYDPHFGLTPWRTIFLQWTALLRQEIEAGNRLVFNSKDGKNTNSAFKTNSSELDAHGFIVDRNSQLLVVEMFFHRVLDATKPIMPAVIPENYSYLNVPHSTTTAAALYCFVRFLLPTFGSYVPVVRLAIRELIKTIYLDPPAALMREVNGEPIDETEQQAGDGAAKDDDATLFVSSTYATEFHRMKDLYRHMVSLDKRKAAVMDRQDRILNKTIVRMQVQTTRRVFAGWKSYTDRAIKLRARYKMIFASMHESVFMRLTIRRWKNVARSLFVEKQQHGKVTGLNESSRRRQLALNQELNVLVDQKRIKEKILERHEFENRELRQRRNTIDSAVRNAKDKNSRISGAWQQLVDAVAPAPSDEDDMEASAALRQIAREIADDSGFVGSDAQMERWKTNLVKWISTVATTDSSTSGPRLMALLSDISKRHPGPLNIGVLTRGQHLLPILRLALTLSSPPKQNIVEFARRSIAPAPESFGSFHRVSVASEHSDGTKDSDTDEPELLLEATAPELANDGLLQRKSLRSFKKKIDVERRKSLVRIDSLSKQGSSGGMISFVAFDSDPQPATEREKESSTGKPRKISFAPETVQRRRTQSDIMAVEEAERYRQLEPLLKGISECSSGLSFAGYILNVINRLSKQTPGSTFKVLPQSLSVNLSRQDDSWRYMVLSFLQYIQFGAHCSSFKNIPTPKPPEAASTTLTKKNPRKATGLRHSIYGGTRESFSFNNAAFQTASEVRTHWSERLSKREEHGVDEKAKSAMDCHHALCSEIAKDAFYGEDIRKDVQRIYNLYRAASPHIANSSVITNDFITSKLRIIFGKDSSFWKPVVATRTITSSKELEELVVTVASLANSSAYHLCDRLSAVLDDTDMFFVSLGSEALLDALSTHLSDLSIIFSMYAEGEPPQLVVTLDGWLLLNRPLLDATYNEEAATQTYYRIVNRNEGNANIFRKDEVDELNNSIQAHQVTTGDDPAKRNSPDDEGEYHKGLSVRRHSREHSNDVFGSSAVSHKGIGMDGFCQALCVVLNFKNPNPFIALDAKVHNFVEAILVPMVGAKSKTQQRRLSLTTKGPGAALADFRRKSMEGAVHPPIHMHQTSPPSRSPKVVSLDPSVAPQAPAPGAKKSGRRGTTVIKLQ